LRTQALRENFSRNIFARRRHRIMGVVNPATNVDQPQLQNRTVMPREGGASSIDGLAITGSPAFAGDDG
jgi:hypothetical protein